MYTVLPLVLSVVVAVGIIVVGVLYVFAPNKIMWNFGLNLLPLDAVTVPWLRPKGVRDIVSGVAVLTLILTTDYRTVGIIILIFALIPFGDMSNVLWSGGQKRTAFLVHGLTCAVMLITGLLLLHIF